MKGRIMKNQGRDGVYGNEKGQRDVTGRSRYSKEKKEGYVVFGGGWKGVARGKVTE